MWLLQTLIAASAHGGNWHLRDHQPPATEGPLTEVLRKRVCLVLDRPHDPQRTYRAIMRAHEAYTFFVTNTADSQPPIGTHCHLDQTSGNAAFADVPILAHEKTLAAMNACLGPRHGENWSIRDLATKLRFLFGQNILELVPHGDPARRWFEDRISLPDYDTLRGRRRGMLVASSSLHDPKPRSDIELVVDYAPEM